MRTQEKAAKVATVKPVTVTLTGELAQRVRKAAKQLGMRPETFARCCVNEGEERTDPEKNPLLGDSQGFVHQHPGKLPVFLPAGMVRMARAIVEDVAKLPGGLDRYLADSLASDLDGAVRNASHGIIHQVRDCYDLDNEEETVAEMKAEASRWQYVGGCFVKKEVQP